MKLAVIHLTRMKRGSVCVAGVDVATGQTVRPVLPRSAISDQLCSRRGGPFDMATVVDLGTVRPVPQPPELEDHEFTPWHARAIQQINPKLFGEMLGYLAKPTLRELFGPALRQAGRTGAIVDVGEGSASLGCLAPSGQPQIVIEERDDRAPSIRLQFADGAMRLNLSVTDLRFWEDDHVTPRYDVVQDVSRRLDQGIPCLLSVGLTRPFASRAEEAPVHWLQVNNIHLEDNPAWRLSDEYFAEAARMSRASSHWARPSRPSPDGGGDLDDLPF
jgi:hypothetical protein